MTKLVKELKRTMKENKLSAEETSHYLRCSAKTIFRWLKGENDPTLSYQRIIRNGIDRINEAFPKKEKTRPYLKLAMEFCPGLDLSEEQKDFYESVLEKMTGREMHRTLFYPGISPEGFDEEIKKFAELFKKNRTEIFLDRHTSEQPK